jgi:glycosyltransferase involved in cell wall biosynthesis
MSRIVIDARELRTSTGRYIERLLHYLQQIDEEHQYRILLRPEDMSGWEPINPRFTPVACPYKEFTFGEQLGFARQLRRLRGDLVHFGMTQQPLRYWHKKVTTVHDLTTARYTNPSKAWLSFKAKQLVYRLVIKQAARQSAAILVGSQYVKDDLVTFTDIKPEKITVTYEAAEPIAAAAEPVISLGGHKFLLYVGRPTPHKNLERLIEAFVQLKAQHPDLVLVLAGKRDANYERIEAEAKRRTIKHLHFTGHVSEGQLRWLYEHCAAYVFPSLSEGFGLPGLEAMVHGAPVVSSNATCLPEIYGEAAHFFDPLDIPAMANAINEVLTDKELRENLIKLGHEQAKKYSWQRMAEQTLAVYDQVLSRK